MRRSFVPDPKRRNERQAAPRRSSRSTATPGWALGGNVTQKVAIDTNPLTSGPAPDLGGRAYAEASALVGSCADCLCPTPYVGTSAKQRHADVRAQLRGPVGASRKVTQKVAIDTNPLTFGPAPDFGGLAYAESALWPAAVQITPDMSGKR